MNATAALYARSTPEQMIDALQRRRPHHPVSHKLNSNFVDNAPSLRSGDDQERGSIVSNRGELERNRDVLQSKGYPLAAGSTRHHRARSEGTAHIPHA